LYSVLAINDASAKVSKLTMGSYAKVSSLTLGVCLRNRLHQML